MSRTLFDFGTQAVESASKARRVDLSVAKVKIRPKILQVLEATALGTASYMSNLLLNLNTEEFDVALAYSVIRSDEKFRVDLTRIEKRGIQLFEIPMQRQISVSKDLKALVDLYTLIKKRDFDIVHGHSSKAGFLGRIAAKLADPSVVTVYSPHAISVSLNRKYWILEKLAAPLTDMVVGVSRSERDQLSAYHIVPAAKLMYVATGIDVGSYSNSVDATQFRRKLGVDADTILIGSAGRLTVQKDPATFVRAAARLLKRGVKAHFAWAGYGELEESLKGLARALGIANNITFLGYCLDIRPFLSALDIFALTSRFESFGYVTCEAMATGKPVVATNVCGTKELVVPGVTGHLLAVNDDEAFARAFERLSLDAELRYRLGQEGRRRIKAQFDLKGTIAQIEGVYRQLATKRYESQNGRKLPADRKTISSLLSAVTVWLGQTGKCARPGCDESSKN